MAQLVRPPGADPDAFAQPDALEALRDGVVNARRLRVVGAGHSFTPLVPTNGTLVNLDRMGGIRLVDPESWSAWVGAGSRLRDLSPAFQEQGLAFNNLGDIDAQALAGAVGTATHGTGLGLPCLSADITGARMLTADGDDLEITLERDPEQLRAVQVSLGALGVIHELRVALRLSFRLYRRTWAEPLETKGPVPTRVPGMEWMSVVGRLLRPKTASAIFIHGGNWLADPVDPPGLHYNRLLGRSSNQEMLNGDRRLAIQPEEFVFLRPRQSEAVFLQFGDIAVHEDGAIVDWWPVLPPSA